MPWLALPKSFKYENHMEVLRHVDFFFDQGGGPVWDYNTYIFVEIMCPLIHVHCSYICSSTPPAKWVAVFYLGWTPPQPWNQASSKNSNSTGPKLQNSKTIQEKRPKEQKSNATRDQKLQKSKTAQDQKLQKLKTKVAKVHLLPGFSSLGQLAKRAAAANWKPLPT